MIIVERSGVVYIISQFNCQHHILSSSIIKSVDMVHTNGAKASDNLAITIKPTILDLAASMFIFVNIRTEKP